MDGQTRQVESRGFADTWVPLPAAGAPLTLPEVARLLRVSERTVRRMVKRGELPAVGVGHQLRFPLRRVMAMVEGEGVDDGD